MISLGYAPRDGLLRMGADLPIVGAGDVVLPGCTLEEASPRARGGPRRPRPTRRATRPGAARLRAASSASAKTWVWRSSTQAWREGWTNAEILKRYTTATMGPCQGAMCGRHLATFAGAKRDRPPAPDDRAATRRPVRLEDLAGGVNEVIEKRTALHDDAPRGARRPRLVGELEAPVLLRRRGGRVSRRARAREPDGREHAGQVPGRWRGRARARRPRLPMPDRRPRSRPRALPARAGRGRLRHGRRARLRARGRPLLPHVHLRRRRPDGGLAA